MERSMAWLQSENYVPAISLWNEIWNTHKGIENLESWKFNQLSTKSKHHLLHSPCQTSNCKKLLPDKIENSNLDNLCFNHAHLNEKSSVYPPTTNELFRHNDAPWIPDGKVYSVGLLGLHEEIEDFYRYMSPTNVEHKMRQKIVERVSAIILLVFPKSTVEVYGSFRTGLYLPISDIDLVVILPGNEAPSFHALEDALRENEIAQENSLKVLDKASVPIIKLTDKKTGIKVDVSFNMTTAVQSAELIQDYMKQYPSLPKLVLVLKHLLYLKNLNEVFSGGISSYSLVLMCISFFKDQNQVSVKSNLGRLLFSFLHFFGIKFNYHNLGISINNNPVYSPKTEFQGFNGSTFLYIDDPLTKGNNIGRGSYGASTVQAEFRGAYHRMLKNSRVSRSYGKSLLERMFEDPPISPIELASSNVLNSDVHDESDADNSMKAGLNNTFAIEFPSSDDHKAIVKDMTESSKSSSSSSSSSSPMLSSSCEAEVDPVCCIIKEPITE